LVTISREILKQQLQSQKWFTDVAEFNLRGEKL